MNIRISKGISCSSDERWLVPPVVEWDYVFLAKSGIFRCDWQFTYCFAFTNVARSVVTKYSGINDLILGGTGMEITLNGNLTGGFVHQTECGG
jgi:hypothetical protein